MCERAAPLPPSWDRAAGSNFVFWVFFFLTKITREMRNASGHLQPQAEALGSSAKAALGEGSHGLGTSFQQLPGELLPVEMHRQDHLRRGMENWVGSAFRRTGPPRGTWRGTAKPPRTCRMPPVPTSPRVAAALQQEAEGIGVQTPPPQKHLPLLAAAARPPTLVQMRRTDRA